MTYGTDFRKMYEKAAVDFLTDSVNFLDYFLMIIQCTNYSAYEFFMNRTTIGSAMAINLNDFYENQLHSTIEFFQLRSVDLPDEFENAIQ